MISWQKKALIDIETTGTDIYNDRIIEIGLVLMDGERVEEEWSSLVSNESVPLSPFISQLTGIQEQMCRSAPPFELLIPILKEKLKDRVVYAHNARFDYSFLKQAFFRFNQTFSPPYVCTVRLSRALFPQFTKHNLDAVRERFKLPDEDRHRALGDTRVIKHFIRHLYSTVKPEKLETVITAITTKPALPPHLPEEKLLALPETTGIYLFKDESGGILYVGKSITIKKRVLSHFYSTTTNSKELRLFQDVHDIEARTTNSEFEALVEEAKLVKELMPIHNRQLRRQDTFCQVKLRPNNEGYLQVQLDRNKVICLADINEDFCLFRNTRAAKTTLAQVAQAHGLCQKFLGLEKTSGACFGYHLGQCQGACLKKESISDHNTRLQAALAELLLKIWPYNKPVLAYDKTQDNPRFHLLHKWCYLDSFSRLPKEVPSFEGVNETIFDKDQYRIITQFLAKPTTVIQEL